MSEVNQNFRSAVRNVAVIAHVDHGKTTLVDALLKQTHTFRDNQEEMGQSQILDRNELERERGITILAKNCAIHYKDIKINIIDTPGHADFSGEVERTLGMADGALLIVDAQEGPMPQTRFVLKKALELGLKVIVVVNKIDKKMARPEETLDKVESLFLELASEDSQLEFPVIYAVGRNGTTFASHPGDPESKGDVIPLLEAIVSYIPAPKKIDGPFKMVATSIEYDTHLVKIITGKVHQGKVQKGAKVVLTTSPTKVWTVVDLSVFEGLGKIKVEEAESGEIINFSGIDVVDIGATITDPSDLTPLAAAFITEPTLHMTLGPNTSPFSGREGKFSTSRQIEERLNRELESNLSLRVQKQENGKFAVSGRGELHLSILLETMRREGYEMEVGKPEVITKNVDGKIQEPVEEVSIIVPEMHVGVITEELGKRYATMISMTPNDQGEVEFIYHIPTRALIGIRGTLLTLTKGTSIINSTLYGYAEVGRSLPKLRRGVLISDRTGEAIAFGLANAQERGITFIDPGAKVYEGMIIGQNAKEEDIVINPTKGKKLTNMRSTSSDGVTQLTPSTKYSLEQSLDFLEGDELLEITPESLRLRKKHLSLLERKRH